MAVQLCPENCSLVVSPRISFSHDLSQSDVVPVEQQLLRSNSSSGIDFDFCTRKSNYDQESSSADELFSDGKILAIQIKKKVARPKQTRSPAPSEAPFPDGEENPGNESSKETKMAGSGPDEKQNSNSKSFWRFKRSSSLNCGSGYAGSFCPLPLLSRSNSAGSATSIKRSSSSTLSKENHHIHKQKNQSLAALKSSQASSSCSYQKPPLKKSYGSYGNNGVRINPVLNVAPANLFGLGSIFSTGKDKNKKK
ncbi:uncharacterized protein LOC127803289 [Diospyros lotus]|uniref:uncharacterized protein LOC127803289 n=1 Tax=Diospyros lotus TaxID=55363 RepID=UPI00225A040A|nr:uncharacterized protein LOC127803289 [Diospyros lotus]